MRVMVEVTNVRARATLSPTVARSLVVATVKAAGRTLTVAMLSLAFVDEAESRRLNRTFRSKREVANVLSVELGDRTKAPSALEGEIVLCPTTIAKEARRAGLPVRTHTARLFIHGVLHLLGYDHRTAAADAAMERITARALESL